jgi:hypothetical protein
MRHRSQMIIFLMLAVCLTTFAQTVKPQDSLVTVNWTYYFKDEINTAGFRVQQSNSTSGPWTDVLDVASPAPRSGSFIIHFPPGVRRLYFIVHAYATAAYRDQQLKAVPPITQEYISSTPPVPIDLLISPGPPSVTGLTAK